MESVIMAAERIGQFDTDVEKSAREHDRPNEAVDEKKIKLSLEVTPELNRVIERIAGATGATKSEALRKAIVLMGVAVEAKEKGERLFIGTEPPPGTSREIIGL
jgi:hypothetical protein